MSLLMKALKNAERDKGLALEPMAPRSNTEDTATPSTAQAKVDLMYGKQEAAEQRRMFLLLGTLGVVVIGMGIYFYLSVFMPWVFLPDPPAPPPTVVQATPAPVTTPPLASSAPPNLADAPEKPVIRDSTSPQTAPTLAPPPASPTTPRSSKATVEAPPTPEKTGISIAMATPPQAGGIQHAYRLLQDGEWHAARRAYEKLRVLEPRNADVLLGLGLIAQRQGRHDDAVQFYLKALETDPKNLFAQSSLTGLIARADPQAAETKFKSLVAQQPAAYLYFGLGNVYGAQGRWSEAQSAYFEAQRLAPDSADYAFNLAVALEHIGQSKPALDYYQRALKLMQAGSHAGFDPNQAAARIQQLSK